MFLLQSLVGALFLAALFFGLSYFIFSPQPKVKIIEHGHSGGNTLAYKIILSNPSNMNIYNLEFSVRFDEMYPITSYYLEEPDFKTGILLRTSEDYYLTERIGDKIISNKRPHFLMSAVRGSTNEFVSKATAGIEIIIDKSYNGQIGDILPPTMIPTLRSYSYFIKYEYTPFGLLAPIFIAKKGIYDFKGNRTKADNYKRYTQKVLLSDGKPIDFSFEISGEEGRP